MATNTRQINKQEYNVEQLVDEALAQADTMTLDLDAAQRKLAYLGHRNPAEELVARCAREMGILRYMARKTGAAFDGQFGKISFNSRQQTIEDVDAYLWRRVHGQRQRHTQRYGR